MYFLTGPRGQVLAVDADGTHYCYTLVAYALGKNWMVEYVQPYSK